jgi:hypothetical protein
VALAKAINRSTAYISRKLAAAAVELSVVALGLPLSHAHYAEIGRLPKSKQEKMAREAVEENLTVADLRARVTEVLTDTDTRRPKKKLPSNVLTLDDGLTLTFGDREGITVEEAMALLRAGEKQLKMEAGS